MKQIDTKTKITCAILIIILVAAAIVIATIGFNVEKQYQEKDITIISIGEKADLEKIDEIAKSVLGKKFITVQYVDNFEDIVQISAKEITDEQKAEIVNKINDLYGWKKTDESTEANAENAEETINTSDVSEKVIDAESIKITRIPNVKIWDLLSPYVFAILITTLFILIFIGIRFYKYGTIKTVGISAAILAVSQFEIMALMAITRFPIGRLTPAILLLTYMISVIETIRYIEGKAKIK